MLKTLYRLYGVIQQTFQQQNQNINKFIIKGKYYRGKHWLTNFTILHIGICLVIHSYINKFFFKQNFVL